MFGFIGWIVFGAIVGTLAKFLLPGRDSHGCVVTVLLGVAGALVGGFLGRTAGLYQEGEPAGFIMATIGAILLLWIGRKLKP
ncbi:MAG: GlsB/YeaQ/YmgE family stress response membrane protein [Bryobacterales bacterium]|nr:GlsB/YeaQ/YmgE family stress response membrane protein [Bryobacterales bacterium]